MGLKNIVAAVVTAACGAALAVGPTTAHAAVEGASDARWDGTFDVVMTYQRNDFDPSDKGTSFLRTQTVASPSSCTTETQCPSVRLTRSTANPDVSITSLLRVTGDGTYAGTLTARDRWTCGTEPNPRYTWRGRVDEKMSVRATGQDGTSLTSYAGTLTVTYPPYRIKRDVPRSCKRQFARLGFTDGYRPKEVYRFTAERRLD